MSQLLTLFITPVLYLYMELDRPSGAGAFPSQAVAAFGPGRRSSGAGGVGSARPAGSKSEPATTLLPRPSEKVVEREQVMPRQNRFTGQHVLVTGGSHGIGQAIARRFAQEGASVAINFAKSAEGAQRTLELANSNSEAAGVEGSDHFIVKADVGDQDQVAAMFRDVAARWPTLDVLVNNAGIQAPSPSHQLDHEMLRRVVDVNLLGAAYCSELAIRHFLSRPGGGAIVNCSSVHQIIPKPTYLRVFHQQGWPGQPDADLGARIRRARNPGERSGAQAR